MLPPFAANTASSATGAFDYLPGSGFLQGSWMGKRTGYLVTKPVEKSSCTFFLSFASSSFGSERDVPAIRVEALFQNNVLLATVLASHWREN